MLKKILQINEKFPDFNKNELSFCFLEIKTEKDDIVDFSATGITVKNNEINRWNQFTTKIKNDSISSKDVYVFESTKLKPMPLIKALKKIKNIFGADVVITNNAPYVSKIIKNSYKKFGQENEFIYFLDMYTMIHNYILFKNKKQKDVIDFINIYETKIKNGNAKENVEYSIEMFKKIINIKNDINNCFFDIYDYYFFAEENKPEEKYFEQL